jgi:hypothetical protein
VQRANHRSDFLAATRGALRHRRAVTVKAMARSTWRSTSASESCLASFCEGVMIVPTESHVCSGAVNSRPLFCSIQHSDTGSLRQNMAVYALASQFMNLTNAAVFGLFPPKQFPKPQHSAQRPSSSRNRLWMVTLPAPTALNMVCSQSPACGNPPYESIILSKTDKHCSSRFPTSHASYTLLGPNTERRTM